jgi:hypothetical protein
MGYSKQDCIEELQKATEQLGHPPTSKEWKNGEWSPSAKTMEKKFGSWNKAKTEAGLDTFEQGVTREKMKKKYGPDISICYKNGYEQFAANNETVLHHRLLAIVEYGFDEVMDNCVHHKNEIKWDNRVENISLMSRDEHQSYHINQRQNEGS